MGKCTGHYFYAVAACASMKAPPKREGKSPSQYRLQRASTSLNEGSYKIVGKSATSPMFAPPSTGLYESPSRKEGKLLQIDAFWNLHGASMKAPPKRKGNRYRTDRRGCSRRCLTESPSQKEGKFPAFLGVPGCVDASMKAPPNRKGNSRRAENFPTPACLNESPYEIVRKYQL